MAEDNQEKSQSNYNVVVPWTGRQSDISMITLPIVSLLRLFWENIRIPLLATNSKQVWKTTTPPTTISWS